MYRIFIVEDDRGIAEAIAERVRLWGHEALCARDFRNVAADCEKFHPHIVLLDISLPFFDGYHWCSEIRKASKVPIIFISSASDNMRIVMAMNMGGDDFIAKPFDQSVLMAKIQALLRRTYDFGGTAPALEHRGAVLNTGTDPSIRRRNGAFDKKRIPHTACPYGKQGQGSEPGKAHAEAVGDG